MKREVKPVSPLKGLMNGANLPNWVKLIAVGFALASIWIGQQSAVSELQKGQTEIAEAVREVRLEMRDRLVTNAEFALLVQRVESNSRRLDFIESKMGVTHK